MHKKIIFLIFLITVIFASAFIIFNKYSKPAEAGSSENVNGWAWSENIGWISFNSTNCDVDKDGIYEGSNEGGGITPAPANCPTSGNVNSYGVNIDSLGVFSGYAWAGGGVNADGSLAPTIGWIKFDPGSDFNTNKYPEDPQYSAKVDLTNCLGNECPVSGWARACAGLNDDGDGVANNCQGPTRTDGWDGWIKLRGTAIDGSTYGVWMDKSVSPAEFRNWAWGSDVVGWISFNCKDGGYDEVTKKIYDICSTSNYKVMTNLAVVSIPTVSNLNNLFNPCPQSRIPTFSWDTDASKPYDYEIKIGSKSDCSEDLVSETVPNTNSTSWGPTCSYCCDISPYNNIAFGENTYYGCVRARNIGGEWSNWAVSSFGTYQHCYPYPDFLCNGVECSTLKPAEEEVVTLSDSSTYHNGQDLCQWSLPPGSIIVEEDPLLPCQLGVTFSSGANQPITLTVTDSTGYSCPGTNYINVLLPLPEWKEIAPF